MTDQKTDQMTNQICFPYLVCVLVAFLVLEDTTAATMGLPACLIDKGRDGNVNWSRRKPQLISPQTPHPALLETYLESVIWKAALLVPYLVRHLVRLLVRFLVRHLDCSRAVTFMDSPQVTLFMWIFVMDIFYTLFLVNHMFKTWQ